MDEKEKSKKETVRVGSWEHLVVSLWKMEEIKDKSTSTLFGSSDGNRLLFLFSSKCSLSSFIIEGREDAVGGWNWI